MENNDSDKCRYCNTVENGKFCASCGQVIMPQRISFSSISHEVFHFFTHFDKGFPYTLKMLLLQPGTMQKEYIDGNRKNFQKPFSMFFLCASFTALMMYLISTSLIAYYNASNSDEADFFHNYWTILQVCLLPFYALIMFMFFGKSRYNYAEILVMQLYLFSFLFLLLSLIHVFKFFFPHLETRYVELPAIIIYCVITNLNFFEEKKIYIVIKSIITICINFLLASSLQDRLVEYLK